MLRKFVLPSVGALFAAACGPSETVAVSTGTLALSSDGSRLYAVEADRDVVAVFDTETYSRIEYLSVGKNPARIVAGPDDTLYVSNRGERTVSVLRPGAAAGEKIAVGVEPVGLSLTADGKRLLVVNSAKLDDPLTGSLMAIDTASGRILWETAVGPEPRAVGILGDRAVVPLYTSKEMSVIDLASGQVIKTEVLENNDAISQSGSTFVRGSSGFTPKGMADVAVTPDGRRAFIPGLWSRTAPITGVPTPGAGYYSFGGPCATGAVVSPALITYDVTVRAAKDTIDDQSACSFSSGGTQGNWPPSDLPPLLGEPGSSCPGCRPSAGGTPIQGPAAAIVDPTGRYVVVANQQSNNVIVMAGYTHAVQKANLGAGVFGIVKGVGAGPSGLALHQDGFRLFVHAAFDHQIAVVKCTTCPATVSFTKVHTISETIQSALSPAAELGRKHFFNATDGRISNQNSPIACASCHLEGRDDGHNWGFPDGWSQTPTLVGRATRQTAPYHWDGVFPTLGDFFSHTIEARMGGSINGLGGVERDNIMEWLAVERAPDNPFKPVDGRLSPAAERGKTLFEGKGECAGCHAAPYFTGGAKLTAAGGVKVDVGTLTLTTDLKENRTTGLNPPSLLSVSRTAPYLHDGSARTLRHRLDNDNYGKHGKTTSLTSAEREDLYQYLLTL